MLILFQDNSLFTQRTYGVAHDDLVTWVFILDLCMSFYPNTFEKAWIHLFPYPDMGNQLGKLGSLTLIRQPV